MKGLGQKLEVTVQMQFLSYLPIVFTKIDINVLEAAAT